MPIQRVVLFDIDGTLVSTPVTERSEGRRYREAIRDVVGKQPYVVPSRFAGMVDPQICKILLTELGLSDEEVNSFVPKVLTRMGELYRRMEKRVALNRGVRELLATLVASRTHVAGVLTGNIKAVAEEKLTNTGIRIYFSEFFYADTYYDRTTLVANAVSACKAKHELSASECVLIVGDTPRDIEAANACHATSIGVASGVYSLAQLSDARATHVYTNLEPTKELLEGLGVTVT